MASSASTTTNFWSRLSRRQRTGFSGAVVAVVALVVALLVTVPGGGTTNAGGEDLDAEGLGRAVQGGDTFSTFGDAKKKSSETEVESTVDDNPDIMRAQKAGSFNGSLKSLHGTVVKRERPEHEVQYGAPLGCEEAEEAERQAEEAGEEGDETDHDGAENGESENEKRNDGDLEEACEAAEQPSNTPEESPAGGPRRAPAPAASASFDGLDFATWGAGHPGDTNGDVGPNNYIQTINSSIGIFSKSGTQQAAFTFDTLMSQGTFGNLCDTDNFGDPVVLYDSFEDRWVLTDFAFQLDGSGNVSPQHVYECFAVSKTGDPVAGGWNFYSVETLGGLGDYPKLGVWEDGIYMSVNMFGYSSSGSFISPRVYAFDKAAMYAGAPTARSVAFNAPSSDFTLVPANARLQAGSPPAGTPEYFVSTWQFLNAVSVYKLDVDWAHPAAATFSGPDVPTNATSWPNAAVANATTPAPGTALDTLQIRAMAQAQYTNTAGAESVWLTHTVRRANTTGFAAPRVYQLNVSGGTVAPATLQGATFDPDGANTLHRYIPSLAVDRAGDVAFDYTASSSTTNPTIAYAGRLAGDPVNTFSQGEQTLIAGTGTQTGNCGASACARWGDYSGMSLDPDGCRFWMTAAYYATNGLNFLTRIGSFKFPSCTTVGNGTLSGTVTSGGNPVQGAKVKLGSRTTTTNASGGYSFSVPAGTYPSVAASYAGLDTQTATNLAVPDGGVLTQDFALTAPANPGCFTDTSQNDFASGDSTGCDLAGTPGAVQLSKSVVSAGQFETGSTTGTGFSTALWTGQTFDATDTGVVTSVDANLFCAGCTGTTPNITVSLRATSGGLPTGPDLGTGTITGFSSGSAATYTATFTTPVTVTAGTKYALILAPTANPSAGSGYFWIRQSPDAYAGGSRVTSANSGSSWTADTTRDMSFHVKVDHGYVGPGTFTSSVKDANPAVGTTPDWSTLSFAATTPANTAVKFQVAASNSEAGPFSYVGPDGTAATFFTTTGASLDQFDGKRYLRYQATLTTTDSAATPSLESVTVCFADVAATSLAVSPASGPKNGTAALSATLTANGSPLSGKTVAFTLNGNSVGNAVTNGTGVASIASASLAGINAGSYPNGVAASFAGDATNAASNGTAALTVSGLPAVTPSPTSYDFGEVRVGQSHPGKSFTITNSGDAPLSVSAVTLGGANPGEYSIVSEDCVASSPIAAGGTCTVVVTLSPTTTGSLPAELSLASNAPSSPTTIALAGIGAEPSLQATTSSLVFGPQRVGTPSPTQTVTVNNIGNAPLTIGTTPLTGADAGQYEIVSNGCNGHEVAVSSSCEIKVRFKPTSVGPHNAASLVLNSDDPGSPDAVALSGTGVASKLKVKPKRARFGPVAVNGGSKTKNVKITNTGTAPLTVSAITLDSAQGSYKMKKSKACETSIATGDTCTFTVTFNPKVSGKLNGKITVVSDGGTATVKLQGMGLA